MKRKINCLITAIFLLYILPMTASAAQTLIPVGKVVGLELRSDCVTVAAFDESSNAQGAGVKVGDRLLSIDGQTIHAPEDVASALRQSKGSVQLLLQRGDELKTVRISPTITPDGPKLGIYLRQGVTGIGTVTYYDPESKTFGILGHGVNDTGGKLLQLTGGNVYEARVSSVRKGRSGEPGQLMGALTSQDPIGDIRRNTVQGVFGVCQIPFSAQALPVGTSDTVKTGSATILSTISGQSVQEYSVEILKIYPASRQNGRNLLIRITDPQLLEATGGIVQGMSGSPIIQNGHLIGAVTHVLVNDPTTGYGIFIENMLDAAA